MDIVRRALERGSEGGAIQVVSLHLLRVFETGMWREIGVERVCEPDRGPRGIRRSTAMCCSLFFVKVLLAYKPVM